MSAINEYIDKIKSVLQSKKNADVYILNDKLTLSVFAVLLAILITRQVKR